MNDALIWLALAGVLAILELFAGTFYLLMIGLSMVVGALAAWLGASHPVQVLITALVGMASCLVVNRWRARLYRRRPAANDPNLNFDIGQTLQVDAWQGEGKGPWHARANYRGAQWDVELQSGQAPQPGLFVIREVRGSRLLVSRGS